MSQHIRHTALAVVFFAFSLCGGSTEIAAQGYPGGGGAPCPDENINSWFPHQDTPEPDNAGFQSKSICEFHEWSWQMFLSLTQDVDGQPRFLGFETPYDLLGINNREVLMPRMGKSNSGESFDEFLQAGTDGILVDQTGDVVYYSQYLDDTFVTFMQDNDLTDPNKAFDFPGTTSFPIGAVELKASWRIVDEGEDTSDVFTMPSTVFALANRGGKIVVDTARTRDVTLALVGFHIAGVVNGHPEMIWATFEHVKNAPNVPADFTPDTVISDHDYTFYKAGTVFADCNLNYALSPELKLNEKTQKMSPVTQVCRQYEFGNGTDNLPVLQDSVKTNDRNVADLNKVVRARLKAEGDVFANYREVGAIWFRPTDALKPGMSLASDVDAAGNQFLIGSLRLSNSTIETFTQLSSRMNNCFRCHNTMQTLAPASGDTRLKPLPAKNINISHAFQNIYFWSQQIANGDTLLATPEN